jgi:nitroreductase
MADLKPFGEGSMPRLEIVEDGSRIHKIMPGFIGSYGRNNAPHFIIAVSKTGKWMGENTGFMLEQLVLKLTEMGIGTCWIGGFFGREKIKKIVDVAEGEEVWIVISFGYPSREDRSGFMNTGMRKLLGFSKRKTLEDIASHKKWGTDVSQFLPSHKTMESLLEGARTAPSAANRQPCRYVADEGTIAVFVKRPGGEGHMGHMAGMDTGIALSHIYLLSAEAGIDGHFTQEDEVEARYSSPSGYQYVTTYSYK